MSHEKINLNDYASVVIVRCRITGIPGITKQDKTRTQALADSEGTTKRHGRVTKTLFADSSRATALKKIGSSVRNWIRVASLPGEADGKYMIPAHLFQVFSDKLNTWQESYNALLQEFVDNLPDEIAQDMKSKSGLADAGDYPTEDEIVASARFDWGFEPLPDSSSFSQIFDSDALVREMEERHEAHIAQLFENATEVNLERMRGRISSVMGQLKRYTGDKGQRLHCSGILDGMEETAATARGLNVANNPEVESLAEAMIQWTDDFTPCETLKNERVRDRAIRALGKMLATPEVPTGWESVETSLPAEEAQPEESPAPETPSDSPQPVSTIDVDAIRF